MSWQDREIEELKADEGLRLKAYKDTAVPPVWTIGYGHTGPDVTPTSIVTEHQATVLLQYDFEEAVTEAKRVVPFFDTLTDPRKGVIVNLVFNMGATTFSSFHGTLAALDAGDWLAAASNLMNSKYARQVGARASRLAYRLRTNEYALRT